MASWFVAEGAGNKLAGSLAAYSETIQAGFSTLSLLQLRWFR
jgi:hypothetical protein